MPSKEKVFQFQNGEYILPQKVRFFDDSTKLVDLPDGFLQLLSRLWVKNSGKRFFQGWRDCWSYESRGDQGAKGYPRINRGLGAGADSGMATSLRRYIAGIFFDLDAVDDKRVYVVMKCGNVDCCNPRHMTFADHPNPKLGLD